MVKNIKVNFKNRKGHILSYEKFYQNLFLKVSARESKTNSEFLEMWNNLRS
jgi:hypothetical protein